MKGEQIKLSPVLITHSQADGLRVKQFGDVVVDRDQVTQKRNELVQVADGLGEIDWSQESASPTPGGMSVRIELHASGSDGFHHELASSNHVLPVDAFALLSAKLEPGFRAAGCVGH